MSASDQHVRPQKRHRTAEDPPSQSSTPANTPLNSLRLKRHDELWFDDGSVILVARDTGFRVFRSLLAAQSTVFADMFSSSSSSAEEMLEGCPVVQVSDSPEDVAHFLRVLLPTSQRIFFSRKFSFSFYQISAIIHLAHKYNVQNILDQAIASLHEYFTSNFDAWDTDPNQAVLKFRSQQAIGVINLARLVDRPSLLPTAFYTCALLDSNILDGYRREDKSVEHLPQQDIKRCINGRNKLVEEAFAIILEVFSARPCGGCKTPVTCQAALHAMLAEALISCKRSSASVFDSWQDLIRECARESHLCKLCEQAAIEREYRARKRVWDALPTIFDIEVDGWALSASGSGGGAATATT
ncbi:hypothetical protein LXA43DRAFT_992298 [Ganoderma leucocontextum]|nr:hypothetical protein LXA43DRAFT_992298 [Ganoderma leucocontextum]